MSNEKDPSLLGAAPPPPASSSQQPNNSSGQVQQPPPPYSQHPMQAPYGYYPPGTQMMQQYPGGPIYPQLPPPYSGDPSKQQPQQNQAPPPPYQAVPVQGYPGQMQQQPYFYPGYTPAPMIYHPYQYQMMVPSLPPNVAVHMPDGFDASARFDGVARPSIPPPPPGVAPNMAQMAMLSGQGNQVIIGQKKPSFF